MPPISVHFALGALAAWVVARRFAEPRDRAAVALGLIAGAVAPDLDLIPSSLSFLVTFTTETGKLIHRTFTHSYLACALLLVAGLVLASRARGDARRRAWGVGLAAAAGSNAFLHIAPDSLYLVGVKFLWPFSLAEFHFGPLALERFSDVENNVINALDFASESLVWLFTAWLAASYGTANRFTRMLPALAIVNFLYYSVVAVGWAARMDYDTFLIVLYSPGLLNIIVTCLLVWWLGRETWVRMVDGELPGPDPVPPLRATAGKA